MNVPGNMLATIEMRDDAPTYRQRMFIILSIVIGNTGDTRVNISATELLGTHLLTSSGLDERRASQENCAIALYDHRLVTHSRNIRTARRTGPHHGGNLWNTP